ncbi:hypothetical protein ACFL6K_02150 [Candidatus Latescibacterota bacterium]
MNTIMMFALYEFKLTLRSHTFHIFAFIASALQIAVTVFLYLTPNLSSWGLRAIPASIPYTAALLFNALAAVGVILIATEFLNRDLKLDTATSVYYRNFPTPLYFIGKGLGIILAMLGLELLILSIPFTVNLVFLADTPVSVVGYLLYPLIITIPSLLFIIGLSWFLMLLMKSQSFAFMGGIIILIASAWSNNLTELHHLLDYPGIRVPALYGDFMQFGGTSQLLLQRGLFAALGLSLMAVSPLLLSRLPQSKMARRISVGFAVIMVIIASGFSVTYLNEFNTGKTLRANMRTLNHEYGSQPRITINTCDLTVDHQDMIINASAAVKFENRTETSIDTYIFSLNPGLTVEDVFSNSRNLAFTRKSHLIFVTPSSALASGESDSLIISYTGSINDDACYLDTAESDRADSFPISFMNVRRMYGTITPECVFLTPETLWYPVAGVPYGSTFPNLNRKDFTEFSLTVSTNSGMSAVSQGFPNTLPDGRTSFRPLTPLPHMSLAIADYQIKTVEVDSISYSLYHLPGHDYFTPYISDIEKEIPEMIRTQRSVLERQYSRSYPYDYFTTVEVPIQFYPCKRSWTVVQDNIQPGMVFVNEKGTFMQDIKRLERALRSMRNSSMPESQISSTFFINIIIPMIRGSYDTNTTNNSSASPESFFSMTSIYRISRVTYDSVYNLFPNFYSFTNHLYDPQWPIIDTMMERYLAIQQRSNAISILGGSFGASDTANMLLADRSLPEILSGEENSAKETIVMSAKMNQLFAAFRARTNGEEFIDWLNNAITENRFISKDLTPFLNSFGEDMSENIESFLDEWYHATELPICRLSNISYAEVPGEDRTYYQLKVSLYNPSQVDGLFQIAGRTMNIDTPNGREHNEPFERYVSVPAGEARCISIFDDYSFYNEVTVDTFVSQNLPSRFIILLPEPSKEQNTTLFDGALKIDPPALQSDPGCVIVDDTDPGCVAESNYNPPLFQKLLYRNRQDEQEYTPIQYIYPLDKWLKTFDASLFGDHVRSGIFKKPGDGSQPVLWSADLPESGTYDVYSHLSKTLVPNFMISMRGESEPRPMMGVFHYTIHHDEGASTVDVETRSQDEEWVYLGTFYFSGDKAVVELSDKTDGRVIYADAIKWVKK